MRLNISKGLFYMVPLKYRPIARLFAWTAFIGFVAVLFVIIAAQGNSGAWKILEYYAVALAATIVLMVLAFYSVISDIVDSGRAHNYEKKIGNSAGEQGYEETDPKKLKKLKFLIAIGKLNAKLDLNGKAVTLCDKSLPISERMPLAEYTKYEKKFMWGNLFACAILLASIAINVIYSIQASSAFVTADNPLGIVTGLLGVVVAIVFVIQIAMYANYLPQRLLRNGKKTKQFGLKIGRALQIINFAVIALCLVLVFSAMPKA